MNYKDIEYVVRARPGRDQWTFVISYPRSANPTEVRFSGSRETRDYRYAVGNGRVLLVGTSRIVVGVFGDPNAPVSEGRRGP